MKTYYLKTSTEQEMMDALVAAGLYAKDYDPEDALNQRPADAEMDWQPSGAFEYIKKLKDILLVGTIYNTTETTVDADGFQVFTVEAVDGYHANVRGELSQEQIDALPIIDAPKTPRNIWS
jgi:hypothetical protein